VGHLIFFLFAGDALPIDGRFMALFLFLPSDFRTTAISG